MDPSNRPELFSVGIVLSAVYGALCLLFVAFVTAAATLGFGIATAVTGGAHSFGFLVGGAVVGIVGLLWSAWCSLTLFACWGAWNGSRGWTWCLVALSAIGLLDYGCLHTPICIVTLVGCVHALDRSRTTSIA